MTHKQNATDHADGLSAFADDMSETLLDHVTGGAPTTTSSSPGTTNSPHLLPTIAIIAILIGL
jgi:hypothetical protein